MEQALDTVRGLGPVQIVGADGAVVELPSASQRRLLAALALHARAPVRAEWLCGVLDVPPGGLRTSITRMRRVLGGDHVDALLAALPSPESAEAEAKDGVVAETIVMLVES